LGSNCDLLRFWPREIFIYIEDCCSSAVGSALIWAGHHERARQHEAHENALNRQATAAENALNRQATAAENAANREQELNKLKLKYAAEAAQQAPEAPKGDKNRWFR
jgi:hypothetical protein